MHKYVYVSIYEFMGSMYYGNKCMNFRLFYTKMNLFFLLFFHKFFEIHLYFVRFNSVSQMTLNNLRPYV